MILVELDSGSRKQFTSPAALAEAVGRGEVGPRARIYHQLRNQWLPITQHPEFQRRWGGDSIPLPPLERTRKPSAVGLRPAVSFSTPLLNPSWMNSPIASISA